ncbi:secreted RxLR effector protein 161-like [Henckelia pumila]|uniref:secreted RxLR effector protein 161-like n=1 Tax=Henckelia pumila TaxID=405737 RepID=UPI003C6E3E55
MVKSTKKLLNSRFDKKDMGLADVIPGIKIQRISEVLVLSQTHYVDKILKKFNKDDSALAKTLIDMRQHLSKNQNESVSQLEYSRIIGNLMYLMSCTRPDIPYAISKLSRFTSNPGTEHWKEILRLLRYLRYARDYGLHYTKYSAVIEGYNDANWISDMKDSKSTSGYVFTQGGAAIAWKSSKKIVIARSTMES